MIGLWDVLRVVFRHGLNVITNYKNCWYIRQNPIGFRAYDLLHLPAALKKLKSLFGIAFVLVLCGCGGGGSSAPASVQQANRAPTSVGLSSSSVLEGTKGASIGTLSTSDSDGGSFNYTISGDDASSFRVSGSTLQLAAETAADYETKTSYSITIQSTDSGN